MYEDNFKKYSSDLHLVPPRAYTRATEYMKAQIDMVQKLIDKGYTYIIEDDGIYMDTSKVDDYGKLAQLDFA
jgi:cysteinyl-tRNA synthetase